MSSDLEQDNARLRRRVEELETQLKVYLLQELQDYEDKTLELVKPAEPENKNWLYRLYYKLRPEYK